MSDAVRVLSDPRVRARAAGLLWPPQPRRALAGAASLPWLVGRGPSLGVLLHLHARWRPDAVALADDQGTLTWRELDERVNRLARAIEADASVPPGATVAVLLRNGRAWIEAVLAAQRAGRVALPMNTWARRDELAAILERERPALLISDARSEDAVAATGTDARRVVVGGRADGAREYEALLAEHSPRPVAVRRSGGRNRIVLQTSGTTGVPKGALRDTGGGELAALLGVLSVVPLDEDDVVVVPAPLFHAFGLLVFALSMVVGARLVLPDRFDPLETPRLVERHRATALALVPVMLRRVLRAEEEAGERADASSLRLLLASGDAIPPALREQVAERFGPVLHDLYGSTEAGWVAVATPASVARAPDAVGRPVPGVRVAIRDEDGRALPAGELGEIHVASGAGFHGYTHDDAPADGEVATGDVGWLDPDGLLHVEGRADDLVIVGGENVYPAEVEQVVEQVDGVEDVAVSGEDDDEYGQVLVAHVVGEASPEAVREACRERLATFKVPRRVEVVDELPRTTTGKVRRGELGDG